MLLSVSKVVLKCLESALNASKVLAKAIYIACLLLAIALNAFKCFIVLGSALSACYSVSKVLATTLSASKELAYYFQVLLIASTCFQVLFFASMCFYFMF